MGNSKPTPSFWPVAFSILGILKVDWFLRASRSASEGLSMRLVAYLRIADWGPSSSNVWIVSAVALAPAGRNLVSSSKGSLVGCFLRPSPDAAGAPSCSFKAVNLFASSSPCEGMSARYSFLKRSLGETPASSSRFASSRRAIIWLASSIAFALAFSRRSASASDNACSAALAVFCQSDMICSMVICPAI